MKTKVFGPPGTGKTTYLIKKVQEYLDKDVRSNAIGFFSYTRKAANEARDRAIVKFDHLNPNTDFENFRTLHSLALRCVRHINKEQIMKEKDYKEFCEQVGLSIESEKDEDGIIIKTREPVLDAITYARNTQKTLRQAYNDLDLDIEWFNFQRIDQAYKKFKEMENLIDYTDMLEMVVKDFPDSLPSLDVLIIDEAQDLSKLQWSLVNILVSKAKDTFIAGDDDQAIYTWAGADVNSFLAFRSDEVVVLKQSYRLPSKVFHLANKIANKIIIRQEKNWLPREFEGTLNYINDFDQIRIEPNKEWLILSHTNADLRKIGDWLKTMGVLFKYKDGNVSIAGSVLKAVIGWEALRRKEEVTFEVVHSVYKYIDPSFVKRGFKMLKNADKTALYTIDKLKEEHGLLTEGIWHEVLTKIADSTKNYMIALLKRGIRLKSKPKVQLSTIHGAKGAESENVLLLTDISSAAAREFQTDPDNNRRLFYVGVTRAKENLYIVRPHLQSKSLLFQLEMH